MQVKNEVDALTPQEIQELKEQYGPIFKASICDTSYLCRLLYNPDWDLVNKLRSDNPRVSLAEVDEKIVSLTLIAPQVTVESGGWSTRPAGVVPSLSMLIRAKSGFIVPELDESTVSVDDLENTSEAERPDEKTLADLKETHKGIKGLSICGDYYVVRPVTRNEFRQVTQSSESEQDMILSQKAVVWPKGVDWGTKPAGICDTVAQLVLSISGYSAPKVEDL